MPGDVAAVMQRKQLERISKVARSIKPVSNALNPTADLSLLRTPLDVRSQICHAQLDMAIRCLKSFQHFCVERHQLTVHDDGTLTAEDCLRLQAELSDVRIMLRSEAFERVGPLLLKHPSSLKFHREFVFGPKLIDMPLLAPAGYIYIDHDILFLRRFVGLRPAGINGIVFMRDLADSYCMTFRQRYLSRRRFRLPDRVNAGLMVVGAGAFNLDRIETFLNLDRLHVQKFLIEQTGWAIVCGETDSYYWDPAQICFPSELTPQSRPVAVHFITPMRKRFADFSSTQYEQPAESPTQLRTFPATHTGTLTALVRRLMRGA